MNSLRSPISMDDVLRGKSVERRCRSCRLMVAELMRAFFVFLVAN
jgi:hypothetical protein